MSYLRQSLWNFTLTCWIYRGLLTREFMKFSLYFPRWDFCIFNWILFVCKYWKYEQGKECTENQRVMFSCIRRVMFISSHVVQHENYSCTIWEYIVVRHGNCNKALLLSFDAKSCKIRMIFYTKIHFSSATLTNSKLVKSERK